MKVNGFVGRFLRKPVRTFSGALYLCWQVSDVGNLIDWTNNYRSEGERVNICIAYFYCLPPRKLFGARDMNDFGES